MIDPFTVVVTALGLAIVASLRLTAGISGNVYAWGAAQPGEAAARLSHFDSKEALCVAVLKAVEARVPDAAIPST
jgi:hypothetical protein